MDYTVEEIISLIYSWLKDKHLLKTSQTLEQEYGKSIPEQSGPTLANIIQTYQSLALLLSSFNSQTQKIGNTSEQLCTETSNKVSNVSKGNKKSTTKKGNTKNVSDEKKMDYSPIKTNKVNIENEEKTEVPKKKEKKKPFMPPGEWVCPQMADALYNVYERNRLSIIHPVGTDNIGICNEVADCDLPAVPNVIEETVSEVCSKKKTYDGTDAGTGDSESDSSNDDFEPTKKTKNTLVKLSNGVTLESPYRSNKQAIREITKDVSINKSSIQNNKPEKNKKEIRSKNDEEKQEGNGGINVSVESNDDLVVESGGLDEIIMNKSRRKSKKLFDTKPPIYDDINNDDDFISKKSKKKKKMDEHVGLAEEQNGEYETVKKKKKKKRGIDIDVTGNNDTIREYEITNKKKKKKVKYLEENQITENSDARVSGIYIKVKKKKKQTEFEEAETDIPLDSSNQTVKKKKKRKVVVD